MRNYRFFKSEHGGAMVMVALMMTVLLGLTAIVVDAGRLYSEKSSLQKALDAAVLAGGQLMVSSEAQAKLIAKEISEKNGYILIDSNLESTATSLRATKKIVVPMTFAKVLGIHEVEVEATARVIAGPLTVARGLAPLAVELAHIKEETTNMKCTTAGQNSGNCGYLKTGSGGASSLADAIKNGSNISYTNGQTYDLDTEPGEKWGPVKSAFEELINRDQGKTHCQSYSTADNSCARVLYVAVVETFENANGRDEVKVVGFAAYWIQSVVNSSKSINGKFIQMIAPGEIDESGTGIGFGGLYGVKLVD